MDSALEGIYAGFDGKEFYPSKEEKGASHIYHIVFSLNNKIDLLYTVSCDLKHSTSIIQSAYSKVYSEIYRIIFDIFPKDTYTVENARSDGGVFI